MDLRPNYIINLFIMACLLNYPRIIFKSSLFTFIFLSVCKVS